MIVPSKKILKPLLIFSISFTLVGSEYGIAQRSGSNDREKFYQDHLPGATYSKWNGFDMVQFKVNAVDAIVVFPNQPDEQKNWIWRTQFWGHEPQVDTALVARGFHLVYINLKGLYGSPTSMIRCDEFYQFLTKNFKLRNKMVLEGMSRGGLDAYNWASENTGKVLCIYADAPVCDIKSWPGDRSKENWDKCLAAYGLTAETVSDFKGIPIYNCRKVAEAKIPVLHVCGDKDTVVPIEENTYKLAEEFRKAGGDIQIIIKEGVGHHPHCLQDPAPIVDFILRHTVDNR